MKEASGKKKSSKKPKEPIEEPSKDAKTDSELSGPPSPSNKPERDERGTTTLQTPPITWQINVNPLLAIVAILSATTRLWRLEDPSEIVFDEVHFGKFVTYYTHGIYFFDVHPPLGKQLLALVAHWTNYDGAFDFDVIGREYDPKRVPYYYMRLFPALAGACVPPLAYQIVALTGASHWSAFLTGILLVFDNAMVTQTRFILLDAWLLVFVALVLYSYAKFKSFCDRPFSVEWSLWLGLLGFFLGCVVSVKLFGFFLFLFLGFHTLADLWRLLGDSATSNSILCKHFALRFVALLLLPLLIFASTFWIEFRLLHKSGPHDAFMSRDFQATLAGSRVLTHPEELPQIGQEYRIAYGSHVTLRRSRAPTSEGECWLHSHAHLYPVRYPDERGSSAQQQVTCYNFRDENNWWAIQRRGTTNVTLDNPPVVVRDGDVVHLVHRTTTRRLNSHNVAAPMTPTNQEVSGYINYGDNVSVPHEEWIVKIVGGGGGGGDWTSTTSQVKLVHAHSGQALRTTEKRLPEWGFYQFEVTTNSESPADGTEWIVEEVQFGVRDSNATSAVASPLPRTMSFLSKLYEVVALMVTKNSELVEDHAFSSRPGEWPLAGRTIAYWMSNSTSAQIQLIGNPLLWWTASLSVVGYSALLGFYLLRRRRRKYDVDEDEWRRYVSIGWLFVGGWAMHYLPFFAMGRALFLHHYLPASIFKVLLLPCLLDHVYRLFGFPWWRRVIVGVGCLIGIAVALSFWYFSAFTYGLQTLDGEAILARKWLTTWDFLVRRPDGQLGLLY